MPIDFERLLAEYLSQTEYTTQPGEALAPVTFHFDLGTIVRSDTIMVILSNSSQRIIYKKAYQSPFTIQAGSAILEGKGFDHFKILFFNTKTHEVYVGEHEAAFWQAHKHIYIELLPFREMDTEIGVPVAFKVRVE